MGRTHQPTYPKTQKTQTPPSASQNPSMAFLAGLAALLAALLAAAFRRIRRHPHPAPAAGFFHPYTNDGGGGERCSGARCAPRRSSAWPPCAVFTGDADASPTASPPARSTASGSAFSARRRFGFNSFLPVSPDRSGLQKDVPLPS